MKKNMFSLAFSLILAGSPSAYADNYALIMGVSDYPNSPLPGIPTDITHARELAKSMNIPNANIVVKQDGQLTLSGMRHTFDEFERKIKQGDRVFIYFSGHGRSFSASNGQCEKAIVARDGESLTRDELQKRIQPIIDRAAKTFVFLDTCFSGGVVASSKADSRSGDEEENQQKIKALHKPNDPCAEASNFDYTGKGTRDFDVEASNTPNYYLLGAAGPTEYAIDGGARMGSLATTAFTNCTNSSADQNNDGIVTLTEAYRCAQQGINRLIAPPYSSQTLTEGNGPGGNTPVAFEQLGNTNAHPVADSQPVSPVVEISGSNRIDSHNLMETITQTADATHVVTVTPTKTSYQIGSDFLEMDVSSSKSGYLTIFSVGSSGTIFQLFPNQYDKDNRIETNASLHLPRAKWQIRANGPVGKDRFVAIVSGTADRFSGLGVPVTPFKKIANDVTGAREIIKRLVTPDKSCKAAKSEQRDFSAVPTCSSGYGAGYTDVQEMN